MALNNISPELEDLIKCGGCHLLFNENDAVPKIFDCRHYFCLKCVNSMLRECNNSNGNNGDNNEDDDSDNPNNSNRNAGKMAEVYCIHCWKRTEINGDESNPGDNLPTHKAILYLSKHLNKGSTNNTGSMHLDNSLDEVKTTKTTMTTMTTTLSNGKTSMEHHLNGSICAKARSDSLSSMNSMAGGQLNLANNFNCNGVIERQLSSNENCLIHAMPNTLWCNTCNSVLCRGCAAGEEHRNHIVKNQIEAKEFIQNEIAQELQYMHKSMDELHNLMLKQRNFLLKILECCTALKSHIEMELVHQRPTLVMAELHETMTKFQLCLEMLDQQTPKEALSLYASVQSEKLRLTVRQRELFLQYKFNEGMRNCSYLFDYDILKQILMQLSNYAHQTSDITATASIERKSGIRQEPNGLLLLTNYCVAQMYSRHSRLRKQQQQSQQSQPMHYQSQKQETQRLHLPHYNNADPPNINQQGSMMPSNLLQTMISNVNMPPGLSIATASATSTATATATASLAVAVSVSNKKYFPNGAINCNNNDNNNDNNNNDNDNNDNDNDNHMNLNLMNRTTTTTSYAQALLQNQSTNQHQQLHDPSTISHHTTTQALNQDHTIYTGEAMPKALQSLHHNVKGYPDLIAPLNPILGNGNSSSTINGSQTSALTLNCLFNHMNATVGTGTTATIESATTTATVTATTTTTATSLTTNLAAHNYYYNSQTTNDAINNLAYSLNQLQKQQEQQEQQQRQEQFNNNSVHLLMNPNLHVYPIYYFNIEMNGQGAGRILIEVRNDVAPKMAKNFNALATHEFGFGYKGCHIFQCWENESIITGDFEHNNGRGGRSVYDECYFMPDDTKILAVRGAVGMRRSQRRHDNLGLVGSQFRIILREMRCFTGIFAFVIDGLDLVDKISQTGDTSGKPKTTVVVVNCGKYQ